MNNNNANAFMECCNAYRLFFSRTGMGEEQDKQILRLAGDIPDEQLLEMIDRVIGDNPRFLLSLQIAALMTTSEPHDEEGAHVITTMAKMAAAIFMAVAYKMVPSLTPMYDGYGILGLFTEYITDVWIEHERTTDEWFQKFSGDSNSIPDYLVTAFESAASTLMDNIGALDEPLEAAGNEYISALELAGVDMSALRSSYG